MSSRGKALFAVYCDEPSENTTRVGQSTSSAPRRASSKTSSTNPARPIKKALANKENNPSAGQSVDLKSAKSSADAAAKVFGTKQPFSEASPVKPCSTEDKAQSLGYYGAGQPGLQKKNTSQGQGRRALGGFTVMSSSTAGGLRGGDPVKRSTSKLSKTSSSSGLGESRLRQRAPARLHHHHQHSQDAPTFARQSEDEGSHSPALANISEAFSGQGGFHWSPSSAPQAHAYAAQAAQETELDTPQGPLRVLNDAATHPSYADSPLDDTVIFRGSPIKRSRQNNQPAIEQRLRALRL